MKIKICLLLVMFFTSGYIFAQQDAQDYEKKLFSYQQESMPYRILYPDNFSKEKQYPLILFLHGAGERGNNNEDQLIHSTKLLNREHLKEHPTIVIIPQCPKTSYWSNVEIKREGNPRYTFKNGGEPTTAMKMVMALMDSVAKLSYVKENQIYVGGLSMGGMGTYEILSRKPEMFAAAIAICGGGHPATISEYAKNTPIWIFHGAKDNVVPTKFSRIMAKAINNAGGKAKLTIYPNANHNSWDPAFAESTLLNWLFSKQLEKK